MSQHQDAVGIFQLIGAFDPAVRDMDDAVEAYTTLTEAKKWLGYAADTLADNIGRAAEAKQFTAGGVTIEVKRAAPRRTNWDSDGLLRLVLDSRVVNEETGEIESVLDILKQVYPLKGYNARTTALKKLGIDVDEFCQTEWADRYQLKVWGDPPKTGEISE